MNTNYVLFDAEARNKLKVGIDTVYRAVACTLGARGKNVVYRKYGNPVVTNDGVSIARTINPKDEVEAIGADLLKQAAEKTNDEAGDGTTTSTILTHALISLGMNEIEQGYNALMLRREIEAATKTVIGLLDEAKVSITNDTDLLNIATISVEDKKIGEIVRDSVLKAGKDGTVVVEESSSTTIEREDVEGLRFDQGYISPYLVTSYERQEAVLEDPYILVTDKTLNAVNDVIDVLNDIVKAGKRELLIIADDVQGELLQTMVANRIKGVFTAVCVRKPYNKDMLEDIAILVGATAITQEKGIVKINKSHLGSAQKVIVKKDSTTIVGGKGSKEAIELRVAALRTQVETAEEVFQKEKLQERLAKLTGGVVIIKVGAQTEAEMKYLKLKIDDAVNATKAAIADGIIPGGGVTLYRIAGLLPQDSVGSRIVAQACKAPFEQILKNAGEGAVTLPEGQLSGYDALRGEIVPDMIAAGIIDPVKVTKSALTNAASLAGIFITTEVVIAQYPEKE